MNEEKIDKRIAQILTLYQESHTQFPYDDCRRIFKKAGQVYEHLISDLDLYFSDIAGYASWGNKSLRWSEKKLEEVKESLAKSFFQQHPEYNLIEPLITESGTPDLYSQLMRYEKMRSLILELISDLSSGH